MDDADLGVALSILGTTAADVVTAEWIDNGPGWLGVLLTSADAALEVRAYFYDGGGARRVQMSVAPYTIEGCRPSSFPR